MRKASKNYAKGMQKAWKSMKRHAKACKTMEKHAKGCKRGARRTSKSAYYSIVEVDSGASRGGRMSLQSAPNTWQSMQKHAKAGKKHTENMQKLCKRHAKSMEKHEKACKSI